ncbi:hypothetical protein [Pseudomonas nicosulfuronedens]
MVRALIGSRVLELFQELSALSGKYDMGVSDWVMGPSQRKFREAASFYIPGFFPGRSARHTCELGESPSGAYPQLLNLYAAMTAGEFSPQNVSADSDDDWESLWLAFESNGKRHRFRVLEVENSDWFSSQFVSGLNRFAARAGLCGRWVNFYDGDDSCSSLYVPAPAARRFQALKRKYSARESLCD